MDEIWEALEATAIGKEASAFGIPKRVTASNADINIHKGVLLRFLDELDGSLSVSEVREALEQYANGS